MINSIYNQNIQPSDIRPNQSIFVWVDILGFSNRVESDNEYNELLNILNNFQTTFDNDNDYSSQIISDGIILVIKATNSEKLKEIFEKIAKKQLQFILKNEIFIRGGIAVGSPLKGNKDNKNTLFVSSGLSRAVKLEATGIDWPVIGTNRQNINKMKKLFSIGENSSEFFGLMSTYNNKGEYLYFLNFLDFLTDDNKDKYCQLLVTNIKNKVNEPKIKNKYIWLLRYYRHKYGKNPHFDTTLQDIVL